VRALTEDGPEADALALRWDRLKAVTIAGGFDLPNRFLLELDLLAPDAAWATENEEALVGDCKAVLQRAGIRADAQFTREGRWTHVALRIDDPGAQVEPLFDLERRYRRRPDASPPDPVRPGA